MFLFFQGCQKEEDKRNHEAYNRAVKKAKKDVNKCSSKCFEEDLFHEDIVANMVVHVEVEDK